MNDKRILEIMEKKGRKIAEKTVCGESFSDRERAYDSLKSVIIGSTVQIFFLKKGYEEVAHKKFTREAVAFDILKKTKCLYGDEKREERRLFGFTLFNMLIRRYDFRSAWKVLAWLRNPDDEKKHWFFPCVWILCPVLISACFLVHVGLFSDAMRLPPQAWLGFGVFIFLVLLVSILCISWKAGHLIAGIRLFVPRLVAAIFLGHFFINSADELRYVIRQDVSWQTAVVVFLASLAIVSVYLWLEMANQLKPRPDWKVVSGRILQLLPIGICYSLMIGLVAQWIFAASITCPTCTLSSNWTAYLTSASVALVLGLFLQILWEEKPVTEPI